MTRRASNIAAIAVLLCWVGLAAVALDRDAPFDNIDGGTLRLSDWAGQPVLVINTASKCGFSGQYRAMQTLYERYRDQGLVVLAIPSDDFRQELADNAAVKDYCELVYGIDLPMTGITPVTGNDAHPFYQSLAQETGFVPRWNFNKVLLDRDGALMATFGSQVRPLSPQITGAIEALLTPES